MNGATINGSATLDAAGVDIAANSGNSFGGSVSLGGPGGSMGTDTAAVNTINASTPLQFDEVNLAGALNVTADGSDYRPSNNANVGGAAGFTTTSGNTGSITLTGENAFGGDVSASVTGTADITIDYDNPNEFGSSATFEIGAITNHGGTGNLTLANESDGSFYNQNIAEDPNAGGITIGGNVDIVLDYGTQDVLLGPPTALPEP